MIASLRGTLLETSLNECLIEAKSGVGYLVFITTDTAADFFSLEGAEVFLYTHTVVREDALDLYGFKTINERTLFQQVINVSGVGPKSGLAIITIAPILQLKQAIASGDIDFLTQVSGIGKKSAQKIILELQDKIISEGVGPRELDNDHSNNNEVLAALMSLGYSERESRDAIAKIDSEISGTEARLKAVLRSLS